MNVDLFTDRRSSGPGHPAARTSHQTDCAVLCIECEGNKINLFGPAAAKEAFDKIVAIFNEAHPKPTQEQIAAEQEDDDFPF